MTLTVTAAEAIVADRITAVATTLRISERSARAYIDLAVLAEALVDSFAAEEPGAEVLKLPRDAGLRVSGIGRLVAALAQCSHFFARYAEVDEALSRKSGNSGPTSYGLTVALRWISLSARCCSSARNSWRP